LAEVYVEGREFNLALLSAREGVELLPPAEIVFDHYPEGKRRVVCYRAKWEEDSFEYGHTPRSFDFLCGPSVIQRLEEIARACWDLFGLAGYARVDFRVDKEERPWVLEVNTNPCLSPDAGFAAAAARAGLSMTRVVERIVEDAATSFGRS
jgi:D-alanine-D-alanine ligase